MEFVQNPALYWLLTTVHVIGIIGAIAARASEGSRRHGLCLVLFIGCLVAVSGTAIVCMQIQSGLWLVSGVTLGLMVLGTTWDCRPSSHASA